MATIKTLLKILAASFAIFLVLAMIEDYEAFLPLVGVSTSQQGIEGEKQPLAEGDRESAAAAVRNFVRLLAHLHQSGGDPRFAERMDASDGVVEEVLSEVAYLQHNQRRQEMQLMQLDVLDVEPVGRDRLLVRVKEYWIVRTFRSHHKGPSDAVRSTVAWIDYYLERTGRTWSVSAWDVARRAP